MTRKQANGLILIKLKKYLIEHSDMRFGQALFNLGLVKMASKLELHWEDEYHLEPEDLLKRMGG